MKKKLSDKSLNIFLDVFFSNFKINFIFLIKHIFLLVIMLHCIFLGAQEFILPNSKVPFKTIKNSSGLSSKIVNACVQDKNGFIWMATQEGLNRYDGRMCLTIKKERGQINTLTHNNLSDIDTDSQGNLWISSFGAGINYLDLNTLKFKHFINNPNDSGSLRKDEIRSIRVDNNDNLWAIPFISPGLFFLPKGETKFVNFNQDEKDKNTIIGNYVKKIVCMPDGKVWAISNNGLSLFNTSKRNFTRFALPVEKMYIITANKYDANNILIYTNDGLYQFNTITTKYSKFNYLIPINIYPQVMLVDSKKNIWIGSNEEGLLFIRSDLKYYIHFKEDFTDENALKNNDIRDLYEDREGNIWISSFGGGVSYINSSFKSFNHYNYSGTGQNQLSHNIILSFVQLAKNELLISTDGGGLYKFNKSIGTFKPFPKDDKTQVILTQISDSLGNIWLGTKKSGLLKYNTRSESFEQFLVTKDSRFKFDWEPSLYIMILIKDKLWIGTSGAGILIFDLKTEKFEHIIPTETITTKGKGPLNGFIKSLYYDGDKTVWLGHYRGLSFCNINNYTFNHLQIDKLDSSLNGYICVYSIFKDSYKNMWIGTGGQGLLLLNLEKKTHRFFDQYNGFNATQVYGIIEDELGNIWSSTNNGLIKFKISKKNPEQLAFTSFYEESGLQGNSFNSGSYYIDKEGLLYFGGGNGFNVFYPGMFDMEEKITNGIQISDLKIFGISQIPGDNGSILKQSINSLKELKLDYKLYNFSLSFVLPYYSGFGKVVYRYKLEGIDKNWTLTENNPTANYSHLPPGTYNFHIQASINGTNWVKREPLKIIVFPPWWKIWWVQLIIIIVLVALLLAFYFARINILKAQKDKLEETVKIRTGEIAQKNIQLKEQKEEISSQNEILEKQKFELTKNFQELQITLMDLEKAKNALIESEKMASLGILTAGVAHEINNPLNFITLGIDNVKNILSEIQQKSKDFDEQTFEELKVIISYSEIGVRRISDIIDSLRTYSHSGDSEPQLVQLKDLIDSSLIIIKSKIPPFINLRFNLDDIKEVRCKPNQISQVIINIIDNAVDSILSKEKRENEFIEFWLKTENVEEMKYVTLEIENSGPPIPEKIVKKIFDPFYTTKAPRQGSGLGLYISYNIIKEHKGLLKVKNADNKVAFKIMLPY
jgi:signal transduction histidine kinase/ligand-binding sensor domain-containing protein